MDEKVGPRFSLSAAGLACHNARTAPTADGSPASLMAKPPALQAGENTDKGYVNQRVVWERRVTLVERLYGEGKTPS